MSGSIVSVFLNLISNAIYSGIESISQEDFRSSMVSVFEGCEKKYKKKYPKVDVNDSFLVKEEVVQKISKWVLEKNILKERPDLKLEEYDDINATEEQVEFFFVCLEKEIRLNVILSHYVGYEITKDTFGDIKEIQKGVSNIEKSVSNIENGLIDYKYKFYCEEYFKEDFVETKFYRESLSALDKYQIIILMGAPGVGKTYTSKKICLDYQEKAYNVYYSEEGNIANIKEYILNIDEEKSLIILNDFLGQFYMDLKKKETNEFSQLVSIIKTKKNIKLLINTRVVIYKEALVSEKFSRVIDYNSNSICEINSTKLSFEEKGAILYSHLKRGYSNGSLSKAQCQTILEKDAYLDVLLNEKYNPRIIEYVTLNRRVREISALNYLSFITENLEYPEKIWENEIRSLSEYDRIFINTLFSLTNTSVSIENFEKCYNNRFKNLKTNKDTTVNHFNNSLNRLLDSIVQLTVSDSCTRIGIMNPSINAYLHKSIMGNENEVEEIVKSALYLDQLECFDTLPCAKEHILNHISSGRYKKFDTLPTQVFSNMSIEIEPPHYLYILKLLLIKLNDVDKKKVNITNDDIQNYIIKIFMNDYNSLEAHSSLYFALEFSNIYCMLFNKTEIEKYDFTELMKKEKYLSVILNSVALGDEFWLILYNIKRKYFADEEMEFYKIECVKHAITEGITNELIESTSDELSKMIDRKIEENIDDYDDYDDFIEVITEEVYDELLDLLEHVVKENIDMKDVSTITCHDFDLGNIILDDIGLYDRVKSFSKKYWNENTEVEIKEDVKKIAETLKQMFEVKFY